ncbi:hypothetical protein [Acidiphilium sp. PM]|uniref:hypothetical protein n=1 Tax=Acidiphilium sp. PM TaxID=1043206 RepID=UPI0013010EA0|nr:hypothetical protein [Acidiphilium sp. PM]
MIGDICLLKTIGLPYRHEMARPKRLTIATTLRLDASTVERLDKVLGDDENRAEFIRSAVETAIALKEIGLPGDVNEVLFANESLVEFWANAMRRLIETRRAMRGNEAATLRDGGTK